jgi:hypothetical protein
MTDTTTTTPTSNVVAFPEEPSWMKMFIDDLGAFLALNKSQTSVLYALVRRAGSDGMIAFDPDVRERVAQQGNIQPKTLKGVMTVLKAKGIFMTAERNVLRLNPQYFTHEWQALKLGRKVPEIIAAYSVEKDSSFEVVARDIDSQVSQ